MAPVAQTNSSSWLLNSSRLQSPRVDPKRLKRSLIFGTAPPGPTPTVRAKQARTQELRQFLDALPCGTLASARICAAEPASCASGVLASRLNRAVRPPQRRRLEVTGGSAISATGKMPSFSGKARLANQNLVSLTAPPQAFLLTGGTGFRSDRLETGRLPIVITAYQ